MCESILASQKDMMLFVDWIGKLWDEKSIKRVIVNLGI